MVAVVAVAFRQKLTLNHINLTTQVFASIFSRVYFVIFLHYFFTQHFASVCSHCADTLIAVTFVYARQFEAVFKAVFVLDLTF